MLLASRRFQWWFGVTVFCHSHSNLAGLFSSPEGVNGSGNLRPITQKGLARFVQNKSTHYNLSIVSSIDRSSSRVTNASSASSPFLVASSRMASKAFPCSMLKFSKKLFDSGF
jgi:hypothetical protein